MLVNKKYLKPLGLLILVPCIGLTSIIAQEVLEPKNTLLDREVVILDEKKETTRFKTSKYKKNLYFGIGIGMIKAGGIASNKGASATLYGGYSLSEFASIEARYTTLISDVDENGNVSDIDIKNIATYFKQVLPLTDTFTPYGLLGYGVSYYGNKNDDSLQWGLGFNYLFNTNTTIYFDYISFYNDTFNNSYTQDIELSAYSFGTTFKF